MAIEYMAIQHNDDGRNCGWAIGPVREKVVTAAGKYWDSHECYPGEEKGELEVLTREADRGAPWEKDK
jgi:hypothetical protein